MSFEFESGRQYRMPTSFGPAPGPRNSPEGDHYSNAESPHTMTAWLEFGVDSDHIARFLPPGFVPSDSPNLIIEVRNRKGLKWLGGRGYNVLMASFGAVWEPQHLVGKFQAVVWENLADSIITGREELGISKVFADMSDLEVDLDARTAKAKASWDGFEFFAMHLHDLTDAGTTDLDPLPQFQWRYFPSVADLTMPEVSYPVYSPPPPPRKVVRSFNGTGEALFRGPTFQEMPTQYHIVGGLASIPFGPVRRGGLVETIGGRDLSDQAPLDIGR